MNPEIIYQTQAGPVWDWRVALDLFLGGAGVGALLFAVLIDELFRGKYRRICHTAAWLSPILVLAGLVLVMAKMGRPHHLFLTYTNVNVSSPLWWGGVFQPLFVVGAIAYAFLFQPDQPRYGWRTWMGRVLAPLALIVGAYHGLLLSVMVSRPLWNTGPNVVAAMLGFASTGIAVVMLVHLVRMRWAGRLDEELHTAIFLDDMRIVRNALVGILVLQLGTCFLWWVSLQYGSLQDQQALAAANESFGPMFWWVGIGIGLVLPLVIGGLTVWKAEATHRRLQVSVIGLTSCMILVGGFFFRLALVLGGQAQLPVQSLF